MISEVTRRNLGAHARIVALMCVHTPRARGPGAPEGGRRVVELPIAKKAKRGRATLVVTLTDPAGNVQTLTRAIRIPKR